VIVLTTGEAITEEIVWQVLNMAFSVILSGHEILSESRR